MRWKLHAVVRCLEAWRELTAEEVRKRAVTERIVSRMLNRSLFFAMELWRENARENKAMAVKSMRVVMRWKKQAAVRCLEAWRRADSGGGAAAGSDAKNRGADAQQKPLSLRWICGGKACRL